MCVSLHQFHSFAFCVSKYPLYQKCSENQKYSKRFLTRIHQRLSNHSCSCSTHHFPIDCTRACVCVLLKICHKKKNREVFFHHLLALAANFASACTHSSAGRHMAHHSMSQHQSPEITTSKTRKTRNVGGYDFYLVQRSNSFNLDSVNETVSYATISHSSSKLLIESQSCPHSFQRICD